MMENMNKGHYRSICLAGGCFWGLEAYLKKLPGVISTKVGYANGCTEYPSYEEVCYQKTGHAEAVLVDYEISALSTDTLLRAFFYVIDPTSINRQGNDRGTQYRSGIYYIDREDLNVIDKVITEISKEYKDRVVTEVAPLTYFYPAEDYHQDYLSKNPSGYCHIPFGKAEEFINMERLSETLGTIQIPKKLYFAPENKTRKEKLTDIQYRVTQESDTERPFSSEYTDHFKKGIYVDVVTGEPLFLSEHKFDAGCGWPSFSKPITQEVVTKCMDTSHFMKRIEVRSRVGDSHLGHVFEDGPEETGGLRYCINGAALRFIPYDRMAEESYGYLITAFDV